MKKNSIFFFLLILFSIGANAQWEHVNGLTGGYITSIASMGNNIYAGTVKGGVFLSTNGGDSWNAINNGLTNLNVTALVIKGTNIFAGTDGSGIFLSSNNGETWIQANDGLPDLHIMKLTANESTFFTCFKYNNAGSQGIYKSTNNGVSWQNSYVGLSNYIYNIIIIQDNIYLGTEDIMHYSTNNGISWKPMNEWPEILEVNQFVIKDSIYVAGTANHGLYMSFDYGNSWKNLKNFT